MTSHRANAPTLPAGSLTFRLLEDDGANITVQNVELAGKGASLCMSFPSESALESVLCETASRHIAALLRGSDGVFEARALKDSTLKFKTIILARPQLSIAPTEDGGREITLSFERVFGQIMHLFAASIDVADALSTQSRALAGTATETIYRPLFEFAQFLENANDAEMFGDRARLYRHLNAIHHRIRELERHYETMTSVIRRDKHRNDLGVTAPDGMTLQ